MPVIFLPSSPALVPELGIGDSASAALLQASRALIDATLRHTPVASISLVGSKNPCTYTAKTGSFAAWGAPEVNVSAGNYLAELVQRFVLGEVEVPVHESEVHAPDADELMLYCLDGPAGLTDKAPLSLIPTAAQRHNWCMDVLSGVDVTWPESTAELAADGIVDPDPWLALRSARPQGAHLVLESHTHGVGQYVARWEQWKECP